MTQDIEAILKKHMDKKKYELEEMQLQSFFVSSTFIDMQGERDALHQIVLPRLREKASKYGNSVQFIDLRWGISTQDMDSEEGAAKIMEVCLDEIESCKPYMIILLGERYGWMPSMDLVEQTLKKKGASIECYPMSITEMEIQYAMLLNSGHLERCVFCFREPLPMEKLGLDEMFDMVSLSKDELQKLEKLKNHIRQTEGANILEYRLDWDDNKMQLTGYDRFAEQLAGYLENLLERDWGKTVNMSWQKRQYQEDMMLKKTLNDSFVGRSLQVEKCLNTLKDSQVFILEAEGGSGKSSFVSEMARKLEESDVKTHVIYCGNSSNCTTTEDLMEIIGWRLGFFVGANERKSGFSDRRREFYYQKIEEYDEGETVLFIDAIDQLYWDDALFQSWYMPQKFPDNLKIVITTTGVVQVNPQTLSGVRCVKEKLASPEDYEIAEIIVGMFDAEHKQISHQTLSEIMENPCSKNMLALSMMIRRLSMLNRTDFQEIHELEKTMDGDAAIRMHLSVVIARFPQKLEEFAEYYMWEVANFLNGIQDSWNIMLILYLLAATESGFSREDFENLTEYNRNDESLSVNTSWHTFWNELEFARLRRFLGPLLIQKSDGKIDFTHRLIREGLRINHVIKSCAIVLLNYFIYGKNESAAKYESGLPLCRQLMDKYVEDKEPMDSAVYNYLSVLIRESGNLSESDDPDRRKRGQEQLSVLQKSVLMDVSCENGHKHLDTYCEAIRLLIQNDASPRNWTIWFFDAKIAQELWNQGDDGRTIALQIYLAILEGFMKPEKKQLRENFNQSDSQTLCRYYFYAKRLQRMLTSSMTHARIYGKDYEYSWDRVTEDGLIWFGQHLKKHPDQVSVYGNYTAFLIDQADISSESHGAKKYFKLVDNVLADMKMALDAHYDFPTWRIYIRRLAELSLSYRKKQWAGLTSGKKYLVRADELSAEAVRLYELLPAEKQDIRLNMIVCRNRAQVLNALDKTPEAVQLLWQLFEKYHPKTDTLNDVQRLQFSWTNLLLLEYLFRFRKVYANGKSKYEMAKAILQYEAGYVRTNVNVNFNSRYHWARILQIRAYCKWYEGSEEYEKDLAEARSWLRDLAQEQKKDSRGIDGWRYNAKGALEYDLTSEVK